MPGLPVPNLTLSDGRTMPALGFGCYKVGVVPGSATGAVGAGPAAPVKQVLADALDVGYRCFDCAQFYQNEAECGEAFEASGIPREELFLISKVWTSTIFEGADAVKAQVRKSISDLRCKVLDLYLVHWPVPGKHVEAYRALLDCQKEGLVYSVGVSNYAVEDVQELLDAGLPAPVVNQIEINPFLYRRRTIEHFEKLGCRLQAYRALCTFGKPQSLADQTVLAVAAARQRTPAQVLGRWAVQKGFQHIPKSEKKERMIENAALFDWSLSDEDVAKLDGLTPPQNYEAFAATYRKCVVRDTPLAATNEGVKAEITTD